LVRESKTAEIATSAHRSSPARTRSCPPDIALDRPGDLHFWTPCANTSVTFNVPPASSINFNALLTPTVPVLSPTALAIKRPRSPAMAPGRMVGSRGSPDLPTLAGRVADGNVIQHYPVGYILFRSDLPTALQAPD
jgi:hypothetical protein